MQNINNANNNKNRCRFESTRACESQSMAPSFHSLHTFTTPPQPTTPQPQPTHTRAHTETFHPQSSIKSSLSPSVRRIETNWHEPCSLLALSLALSLCLRTLAVPLWIGESAHCWESAAAAAAAVDCARCVYFLSINSRNRVSAKHKCNAKTFRKAWKWRWESERERESRSSSWSCSWWWGSCWVTSHIGWESSTSSLLGKCNSF